MNALPPDLEDVINFAVVLSKLDCVYAYYLFLFTL